MGGPICSLTAQFTAETWPRQHVKAAQPPTHAGSGTTAAGAAAPYSQQGQGTSPNPAIAAANRWGGKVELAQRWLLFMRHCATCPGTNCEHGQRCRSGRALWAHMINCDSSSSCQHPKCAIVKAILKHHKSCTSVRCHVCMPVKRYVARARHPVPANQQPAAAQPGGHYPAQASNPPHTSNQGHPNSTANTGHAHHMGNAAHMVSAGSMGSTSSMGNTAHMVSAGSMGNTGSSAQLPHYMGNSNSMGMGAGGSHMDQRMPTMPMSTSASQWGARPMAPAHQHPHPQHPQQQPQRQNSAPQLQQVLPRNPGA